MSFLRCKALCLVINFLVFWTIYPSSFLVNFKKGVEYFTRGAVQVLIPLIRFIFQSMVSGNFLVLQRNTFLKFSLIFVWRYSLPVFSSIWNIYSLRAFRFFPYVAVPFLPLVLFFHFSLTELCNFSMQKSIPIFWRYILNVCIKVSRNFSFMTNILILSMHITWLIICCDFFKIISS